MITFLNQPTLSPHEVQADYNIRRLELVPQVEKFLSTHNLFKDKDVKVTFPEKGASSLICIIEIPDAKYVLKIPLSNLPLYTSEGTFLKTWEKVGVKVPHVFEEGMIGERYYMLMEYIDAPTLHGTYKKGEAIRKEIFVKMGGILHTMHSAKGKGFGTLDNGVGTSPTFSIWLENEMDRKKLKGDPEAFFDTEKHGDLARAREVFVAFVGTSDESSYCHNDYTYENIFATEPFTVIDPVPILGHPYMDLARAIVTALGRGIADTAAEHLIKGYTEKGLVLDRKILQAALIIQASTKFPYWSKTGKEQGIKDVLAYLEKTKEFLK